MSRSVTFTIGYAERSVQELLAILHAARVDRVVDIRALPLSRRKGFSKTALSLALAKDRIQYLHLRAAGNPYREKKQDLHLCLALFAEHLDAHPEVLDLVEQAVRGHRAALLCLEHEACSCHRSLIADRLRTRNPDHEVQHL